MTSKTIARLASPPPATAHLSKRQKAAIVVRFLLNEGADLRLSDLPEDQQRELTTQMGSMRYVDRDTLRDVVGEFAAALEGMGLTFPRGVAGALSALDGRISPQTAQRLRKEAGVRQFGDPWEQVRAAPADALCDMLSGESTEVAAVLLSKLEVSRAAELLGRLPGDAARRITIAMSQTAAVTPDAVDRIGLSLAAQLHQLPETAFVDGPDKRVGAILNFSQAATRDDVLTGLDAEDEDFAARVRRAIFTFANIPQRIAKLDVAAITREVDQPTLLMALTAAAGDPATQDASEYILTNLSRRMSDALREEMTERGTPKPKDGEAAMTEVVNTIRRLEAKGDITLVLPDEDETSPG